MEKKQKARRSSIMQSLFKNEKSASSQAEGVESKDFRFFTLLLRRRIFPSLFQQEHLNFKCLPKNSLSFVYHQSRQDYVERELIRQPVLTRNQA
jgi:hypothetical protein